jgi:hypothetical protein
MKGFPMVRNELLVTKTYKINSIASMNSRSDSNTFQWLCNIKGPHLQQSWKQGMVERHGWVVKEAAIFSWEDMPTRTRGGLVQEDNVQVCGVPTKKKIKIPTHAKPHLVEYIALQMEAMDDERLQNDLNAY